MPFMLKEHFITAYMTQALSHSCNNGADARNYD